MPVAIGNISIYNIISTGKICETAKLRGHLARLLIPLLYSDI